MIKQILFGFVFLLLLLTSMSLGVLFYVTEQPWVDFSVLENYDPGKASILLDDEGKEWGRFQLDKRDIIKFHNIPKSVINAFIAAEDWSFFTHSGVSIKGIMRSLLVNMVSFKKAQGASTITQQLVRLLYFESKKSFKRKIKEQIIALAIEQQFTKEQILETYLNHIYMGGGLYGVEVACQHFWGKPLAQITIDEAAILASIVRSPRIYCPLYNPDATKKRRNLILKNMLSLKSITPKEYQEALEKPVTILKRETHSFADHAKETIRLILEETIGKQKLYAGGLKIQTTLNRSMQEAAQKAFKDNIKLLTAKYSEIDGALLCIEGSTGAIKSMIGGKSFSQSQFNRAFHARRQMGSSFKPLIYAHALMEGRSFSDVALDEPISLTVNNKEWCPRNSNNKFNGPMTLANALARSNNIIAIKTFLSLNPNPIVNTAQACGINLTHAYPSLALGCVEATPVQAICSMNIFAHQGSYTEPYLISWIKDEWGTKIWKANPVKKQVLSSSISSQVGKVLMHLMEKRQRTNPKLWPTCEMLGKTGTTNDARTCWYIGATPTYTTSIYIGYDDNSALGKEALSSKIALPIFRDFNKHIKQPLKSFTFDSTLSSRFIDKITGQPCDPNSESAFSIFF